MRNHLQDLNNLDDTDDLQVEREHVDGTMNAVTRGEKLYWLKAEPESVNPVCRILTNARCLSEGVDVPTLDAILFLNPRRSQVDVIQAVGRVMRKAEGKTYGYIILPVTIPAGMSPEEALSDNKRYQVVWQVLQAIRAHDERFEATINSIEYNHKEPENIVIDYADFTPHPKPIPEPRIGSGETYTTEDDHKASTTKREKQPPEISDSSRKEGGSPASPSNSDSEDSATRYSNDAPHLGESPSTEDDEDTAEPNSSDMDRQSEGKDDPVAPTKTEESDAGDGSDEDAEKGEETPCTPPAIPTISKDIPDSWKDPFYSRIVKKVGSRLYWDNWSGDIADIASRYISLIESLLKNSDHRKEFSEFVHSLRSTLNPSVSETQAVEMLAQHLITKPLFDAMFEDQKFTEQNPVSIAMQGIVDKLADHEVFEKERRPLESFYSTMVTRIKQIDNLAGKQQIMVTLFDRFFSKAFPNMASKLGIVFTPIPVVDHIIRSANALCKLPSARVW
ncbi:helicase-related protein [Boudabousia marimammalium]|uniref:helicase-related protein n=1 Tax=Boudabousia marimammalium TaxID=156892 RepID=UPI001C9E891D|nr:helicase-related protein [Boudabousia marimammalium]